ncbi:MAG: hypothetical protein GWP10_21155 [Nitrospiraceae bacterium]|nr:hypothetical protein [Nitrospiraceae bacterium]
MTIERADGVCPACGGVRHKEHTFEHDIAVCNECGHRELISNLPDGANFGWVVEQMQRMLGDDIKIEQTEA